MNNICKICNQEVAEKSHFWKIHKIKEKDYYEKYLPKTDLLTGEIIEFKGPEHYELTEFKDKRNFKVYLEEHDKQFVINFLAKTLEKRLKQKEYTSVPSEFELKSIQFPTIKYLEKKFGAGTFNEVVGLMNSGYKSINEIFLTSFNYFYDKLAEQEAELEFIIDTREQSILELPKFEIGKLDYGDYTIKDNLKNIFVERKSLVDFIGTLSKGFDRFTKEINRCREDGGHLVILIEEKYANILGFNHLPHCKRIKATPDFIMHRAREILRLYPSVQMLAVDGRKEAARVLEKIFKLEQHIFWLDLQFYYDKGLL